MEIKDYKNNPAKYSQKEIVRNYEIFARFIKTMYPNAKRILEVGAGQGYLSVELKKMGYDVTAMDIFSNYTIFMLKKYNIDFFSHYFSLETNLDNYDLVIGLHICDATELVIRNCTKYNKDCAITLCEVNQGIDDNNIFTRKQYIDYLKNLNDNLLVTKLNMEKEYNHDFEGETLYLKHTYKG